MAARKLNNQITPKITAYIMLMQSESTYRCIQEKQQNLDGISRTYTISEAASLKLKTIFSYTKDHGPKFYEYRSNNLSTMCVVLASTESISNGKLSIKKSAEKAIAWNVETTAA